MKCCLLGCMRPHMAQSGTGQCCKGMSALGELRKFADKAGGFGRAAESDVQGSRRTPGRELNG